MPQFGQVPLIGQRQQPNQQQMQQQVQAAVAQLSMGIYSQIATDYIRVGGWELVSQDRLRQLAKDSQTAARCYFEGIGVISEGKNDG